MARTRKTPQEKKELPLKKDHFTFSDSPQSFPKTWKRKKAIISREYRRKSDELLTKAKSEFSLDDAELVTGDLTATYLQKSISRERLRKQGTVTLGEKVKSKLEKRIATVGRRVNQQKYYDDLARTTLETVGGGAIGFRERC